ncbi:MAG: hypothetical protein IT323_15420, partial [Anaerolineae bacterium]|nr:hypothetical protein [Anaerolineae bacterium]
MITTVRGFVVKIEIGRAGLVIVTLVLPDGSLRTFVIQDVDADPERFNERLSKLAILRDAMDRAEPVEIEARSGEGGDTIERCVRISRDLLDPIGHIQQVTGLALAILVHSENGATAQGEKHDQAIVQLITNELQVVTLTLDLQAPERGVALAQLDMLRDAEERGVLVRLLVTGGVTGGSASETGVGVGIRGVGQRIFAVLLDDDESAFGSDQAVDLNGFVESLSLIRLALGGEDALGNFAHVRFTTAPPFTGPGNTVGLTPFGPETVDLLTPKNSPAYALFEAGLRDNLRMRVRAVSPRVRKPVDPNVPTDEPLSGRPVAARVRGARG